MKRRESDVVDDVLRNALPVIEGGLRLKRRIYPAGANGHLPHVSHWPERLEIALGGDLICKKLREWRRLTKAAGNGSRSAENPRAALLRGRQTVTAFCIVARTAISRLYRPENGFDLRSSRPPNVSLKATLQRAQAAKVPGRNRSEDEKALLSTLKNYFVFWISA